MIDFQFIGLNHCDSVCGLTIHRFDEYSVVIVSEKPGNQGTSITNAAECLFDQVREEFNLDRVVWIEHYPDGVYISPEIMEPRPETWDVVSFTADAEGLLINRLTRWEPVRLEKIEEIISGGGNPWDIIALTD